MYVAAKHVGDTVKNVGEIVTAATIVLTGVAAVGRKLWKAFQTAVMQIVKNLSAQVEALTVVAAQNLEERGKVVASVQELSRSVDRVRATGEDTARQLRPDGNGGHNMHGAITRIEAKADRASEHAEQAVTAAGIAAVDARAAREVVTESLQVATQARTDLAKSIDVLDGKVSRAAAAQDRTHDALRAHEDYAKGQKEEVLTAVQNVKGELLDEMTERTATAYELLAEASEGKLDLRMARPTSYTRGGQNG